MTGDFGPGRRGGGPSGWLRVRLFPAGLLLALRLGFPLGANAAAQQADPDRYAPVRSTGIPPRGGPYAVWPRWATRPG